MQRPGIMEFIDTSTSAGTLAFIYLMFLYTTFTGNIVAMLLLIQARSDLL